MVLRIGSCGTQVSAELEGFTIDLEEFMMFKWTLSRDEIAPFTPWFPERPDASRRQLFLFNQGEQDDTTAITRCDSGVGRGNGVGLQPG
jgi:hypothetical protein